MARRVVVTGLGLITPVGNSVEATWSALMSGQSGVGYIKKFDTEKFSVKIAAEVKDFDPLKFIAKKEARKMGAFIHYAIAAATEAMADSGLVLTEGGKFPDEIAENAGTYISSGIGDFSCARHVTRRAERQFSGRPIITVACLPQGKSFPRR